MKKGNCVIEDVVFLLFIFFGTWSFFIKEVELVIVIKGSGVNILTEENLQYALESDATVLGVWNAADCKKCASDMWDVYQLFYTYGREKDVKGGWIK